MDSEKRKKLHELLDYCVDNGMEFQFYVGTYLNSIDIYKWDEDTETMSSRKTLYTREDFAEQVEEVISNDSEA